MPEEIDQTPQTSSEALQIPEEAQKTIRGFQIEQLKKLACPLF